MPVFALGPGTHFAAEFMSDEVQPIADTEHRQPKPEHTLIGGRSILIVDRRWTSAQNDAGRPIGFDLFQRDGTRQDNRKYFEFADAARNQLRILRTKVENDDGLFFHEQFSLIRGGV